MLIGHMARATDDNPAAAILRWRCPLWWRTYQELDGPMGSRHTRTNWTRGPEDIITTLKGPRWPEAARDRKAWDKNRSAFVAADTRKVEVMQKA